MPGQGRPLTISQKGLDLICSFEGFSSHVYLDIAGLKTIGFGHKLLPNESYTTITQDQAEALLLKDVIFAEKAVNEDVKVPLTQDQFDGLVSFCYNVGTGAFKNSTCLKFLNEGDFEAAALQMLLWAHVNHKESAGLLHRRQEESKLVFS